MEGWGGSSYSCHSIGHIRFPISAPSLSCIVNEILGLGSQNLRKVTDHTSLSGVIYHACTSTPVCLCARNLKCIASLIPKKLKSGSRDFAHAH